MPKVNVPAVRENLREQVYDLLGLPQGDFKKITGSKYGIILTDPNGEEQYVKLAVTVVTLKDGQNARDLMESEIEQYTEKQEEKAQAKAASAEKAARDKARKEALAAAKKAVEEKFGEGD